jgi:hypothetical protein
MLTIPEISVASDKEKDKKKKSYSIETGSKRANELIKKKGIDESTALKIARVEKETGDTIKVTSGHRSNKKQQKLVNEELEKTRKKYGFSNKVMTAIREGVEDRDKHKSSRAAQQFVKKQGGGSKALKEVERLRYRVAAPGKSKHNLTRNTVDVQASKKAINKLKKEQGFSEHEEKDIKGRKTSFSHLETVNKPTSLGEIREMDKGIKTPLKPKLQEAVKPVEKAPKGILSGAIDTADKLVSPGLQSEEIMSQGTPAEFEEAPKGMSEDLKNKLAMISTLKSEESKLAKPILDYNMKQEIEQAPKVAMVKQESDGAMELQEEIEREKKKALKELTPSVVERTMKAEAPTPKIAEKEVEDVQEAAIQRIQSPVPQKPSGSMSDQFKEALSFFAPTMIGALGGALIEGTEGAVAGAEAGTSLGTSFRDYQLKKAQLEQKKTPSPLDIAKLQVSQGNLEQRKQELEEQKRRSGSLAEERGTRREERDLDRAVSFKKDFSARAEVKKFVEALNDIEDIKTLAVEGKKLPEAIQSKIARSISGEVGVLTDNDIKRAQINPDIKSTIKRKVSLWTEGKLPQTDIDDLLKVAEAIRLKKRERLRESAIGFAKSRDPHVSDKGIRKRFLEDILSENGLDEPKSVQSSNRGIPSDEDIDNMSIEELRAAGLL